MNDAGGVDWKVVETAGDNCWSGTDHMRHISPDGRRLSTQDPSPYDGDETPDHAAIGVDVINYEAGERCFRVRIADLLAVCPIRDDLTPLHLGIKKPMFSPDGRRIAYVVTNKPYMRSAANPVDGVRHHELFVTDAEGQNPRYLAPFVTHPSWRPDSKAYCALVREPVTGELAFGHFPVDGGDPLYWRHEALRAGHPSIQPVQQKYLVNDQFDRERGVAQLWLFRTDDWSAKLLAESTYEDYSNASGTHMHPAWSPDGQSIYFNAAHLGPSQIYRVDIDD